MSEDESLLLALAQLERRRTREAAALREANALLAGLERMTTADGPAEGLAALLDALRAALGCDVAAVLTPEGGDLVFAHAAGAPLLGWLPRAAAALSPGPLRCDDLRGAAWWPGEGGAGAGGAGLGGSAVAQDAPSPSPSPFQAPSRPPADAAAPEAAAIPRAKAAHARRGCSAAPSALAPAQDPPAADVPLRSWISAPLPADDGAPSMLACLSCRPAAFGDDDLRLVARFAGLAAQALANHALAQRNALLAAVVEGASASVVIAEVAAPPPPGAPRVRRRFPLIYVNRAFEALTGWSRAEALGRDCRFLSAEPEDSPERTRLRQALQDGARGRFVLRNRARDGRLFWNELSLHPIRNARGRIDKIVATQVDVTERMTAERDRDRARSRLINALAVLGQGFLLVDDRGRVVFANPPYRDFFAPGAAPWAPGRGYAEVWAARLEALGRPARDAAREAQARLAAMRAGRVEREETLPDGRILLVTEQPAPDGGCMSMAVDVTRLKRSEQMLAGRAAAMDAAQDGIAIVDEAGRVIYMNPAHRAMSGFASEAEALGRPWLDLYAPDRTDRLSRRILPELQARGAWRGELKGRLVGGGSVTQEVSLTLVEGFGLVCVSRDTAERRRAEAEQAKLRDQLHAAQRHEAIGVLAAGIAHDFNNLLSAIAGSAALIAGGVAKEAPERRHAERILAAGGRAADLVARLLTVGRRPAPPADSDLHAALDDATDLVRAGLPPNIDLAIEAADSPLRARLDPTDFLQVLLNLVINARDAIGAAGGVISVTLDAAVAPGPGDAPAPPPPPPASGAQTPRQARPSRGGGSDARLAPAAGFGLAPAPLSSVQPPTPPPSPDGSRPPLDPSSDPLAGAPGLTLCAVPAGVACARLRVRDTGCGIPAERIREIFEPYFTTKGGAGTGLGLSVLASLVQGAGGGLALRSREGMGAEFEVLWPLARADQPEPVAPGAPAPAPGLPAAPLAPAAAPPVPRWPVSRPLTGALVLVVDDDAVAAETLGALLEAAGAEAAVCDHPDDALEALGEDPGAWSLLVTDFEMPSHDGAQVSEAARRLAPGLPVILCSGLGFEAVRRAGGEGLFDAVLTKPIDPDRLIAAATRAISARGLRGGRAPAPPLAEVHDPPAHPPILAPSPVEPSSAPRLRTETR